MTKHSVFETLERLARKARNPTPEEKAELREIEKRIAARVKAQRAAAAERRKMRVTLVGCLEMLGSDNANERAVAALQCHRIIRKSGLTWAQLINPQNRRRS